MLNTIGRIPCDISVKQAFSLLGMLNTIGRIQIVNDRVIITPFARYVKYDR